MVVTKRSKLTRYRGSKTHGCGSMKKRRGAGSRGGRGNAGTGKRGDANKPNIWKNKKYFGSYGFKKVNSKSITGVNLRILEDNISSYLSKGLIKKDGDFYVVDIADLGYNKLLGSGKISSKFKITADYASKTAIDKIKAAGGETTVFNVKSDGKSE